MLVRHGRLAGTAAVDARTDPRPAIESLRLTAEHVPAPVAPAPAAHPEETDLLLDWLDSPGVRLVEASDAVGHPAARCSPLAGAQSFTDPVRVAQAVADALARARATGSGDATPAGCPGDGRSGDLPGMPAGAGRIEREHALFDLYAKLT